MAKERKRHSTTRGRKRLVIARRTGRLANRLILFSNVIAFAEERGYRVINPAFQSYSHLFEGTRDDMLLCPYPRPAREGRCLGPGRVACESLRRSRILYHLTMHFSALLGRVPFLRGWLVTVTPSVYGRAVELSDPEILARFGHAKVVFLYGWEFRHSAGVERHAERIRRYFTPIRPHRSAIDGLVRRARAHYDLLIGMHVRRGDYRQYMGGRYFYPIEVYRRLMENIQSHFADRRLGFLICSDERLGRKQFGDLPVCFGTDVPVEDLYGFARCDLLVGPPSTFTQWASFYGQVPLWWVADPSAPVQNDRFAVASLELRH